MKSNRVWGLTSVCCPVTATAVARIEALHKAPIAAWSVDVAAQDGDKSR
jgi:hypothetical protein